MAEGRMPRYLRNGSLPIIIKPDYVIYRHLLVLCTSELAISRKILVLFNAIYLMQLVSRSCRNLHPPECFVFQFISQLFSMCANVYSCRQPHRTHICNNITLQSTEQPNSQPTVQPTNKPTTNQTNNQPAKQTINQPVNQSNSQPTSQPINQLTIRPWRNRLIVKFLGQNEAPVFVYDCLTTSNQHQTVTDGEYFA